MSKPLEQQVKTKIRSLNYKLYGFSGKPVVHILHIGKTGGTAIKDALQNYLMGINNQYIIYLHGHKKKLRGITQGEKVIFFLRDPINRFISGFYSRKRKGHPRYNIPWTLGEKIAFSQFNAPNELAESLSSPEIDLKENAIEAMNNIIHIKDLYWDWFDNEDYFLSRFSDILFIGFQESLEDDFIKMKRILCLPEAARLPQDEIKAHKNPSHFDTYLSERARQNLREWYARDYKFLELCKEKANLY